MSTHLEKCFIQKLLTSTATCFHRKIRKISIVCFWLTLKVPITTTADDNFDFFFYFQMKTSLDISCESSAKQTIHMKYQDLFSLKNKKKQKTLECRLLQILLVKKSALSLKLWRNKGGVRVLVYSLYETLTTINMSIASTITSVNIIIFIVIFLFFFFKKTKKETMWIVMSRRSV